MLQNHSQTIGMKRCQQSCARAGCQDRGYPTRETVARNRRPATRLGAGVGNLPTIIDAPTGLVSPATRKPDARLALDIKAVPNRGVLLPSTKLRMTRRVEKKILSFNSSSDGISNGRCLSHPVPCNVINRHLENQQDAVPILKVQHRTLPPIGPQGGGGVCNESVSDSFASADLEAGEDDGYNSNHKFTGAAPVLPGMSQSADPMEGVHVPFPDAAMATMFPATLIQERAFQELQRCAATVNGAGLGQRVNNIVRAFEIYGQLDKLVLARAMDKIVSLHPLLSASFSWVQGKLYAQTQSRGRVRVDLDVPAVSHDPPEDLILYARRKLFSINHGTPATEDDDHEGLFSLDRVTSPSTLLVTSVRPGWLKAESCADDSLGNTRNGNGICKGCCLCLPAATTISQQLALLPALQEDSDVGSKSEQLLMRVRLVAKSSTRHILVLSFPRIVCDFWSSCLFMQQLVDAYGRLERNAHYRPSLAALQTGRRGVVGARQRERQGNHFPAKGYQYSIGGTEGARNYVPMFPARLKFEQVAQREKQLLMVVPRERLFVFWEAMVSVTIGRVGGVNRIKIVPPIRIPSGLGEVLPGTSGREGRPRTSWLRPRTASRNRPMLGREKVGGALCAEGFCREALVGPRTKFNFLKIEDGICEELDRLLPGDCQNSIRREDQLYLFTFAVYNVLLGRSCRGWAGGASFTRTTSVGIDTHMTSFKLRTFVGGSKGIDSSDRVQVSTRCLSTLGKQVPNDCFEIQGRDVEEEQALAAVVGESSPQGKGERRRDKLDAGTFLVGVEVSHRNNNTSLTEGVFGPLTNDVAMRVSLSVCETFSDLLVDLNTSLQLARKHGHHPFEPVAEQLGLAQGLPVKFSYLRHHEVVQLANPNEYFYTDTAVGVVDQGLARMGAKCYLTPLNSKLDDNTHFELVLWESYDLKNSLAGGIRYQPHIIRRDLVQAFGVEFCRLLTVVASEPSISLLELATEIRPPFLSSCSKTRKRKKTAHRRL